MTSTIDGNKILTVGDCLRALFGDIRTIAQKGGRACELTEDQIEKLIMTQMKLSQVLKLSNSVKFSFVSSLLKFLSKNPQFEIVGLDLTVLFALTISVKLHQGQNMVNKFNLNGMVQVCRIHPRQDNICAMESYFLFDIGFDINIQTPYDLLNNFSKAHSLSSSFNSAVLCYLDFVLSIKKLAQKDSQVIFAASMIAAYETVRSKPDSLIPHLEKFKRDIPNCRQTATQIKQKLEEILSLSQAQSNSQDNLVSI